MGHTHRGSSPHYAITEAKTSRCTLFSDTIVTLVKTIEKQDQYPHYKTAASEHILYKFVKYCQSCMVFISLFIVIWSVVAKVLQ